MFWLLSSTAMKLCASEWMEAWWFLTAPWHLTFLSSFITKEPVSNHLAVDTIISASIIAWRVEAGNFLRYYWEDGWGQERPHTSRGILNSICQFLPPQCRSRGGNLFCGVFVWGKREKKASEHIIECKCWRLWWVYWYFLSSQNAHCVWQRCSEQIWPLTCQKSEGQFS